MCGNKSLQAPRPVEMGLRDGRAPRNEEKLPWPTSPQQNRGHIANERQQPAVGQGDVFKYRERNALWGADKRAF